LKPLTGQVPEVVARLAPIGRLDPNLKMDLAIGLPLSDPQGLRNFLQEVYDPNSTNFHRFLTPEQFTTRFGPATQDYEALRSFAKTNGLSVTHTYGNRLLLDVNGKASDIEKALHITFHQYQHPTEARTFFAPDTEPTVPQELRVLEINGLSDYSKPKPFLHAMPAGAKGGTAGGSGPGHAYMGRDFRNAYAPGTTLDGTGQMVGLFQLTGYDANDIFAYEAAAGLPNVPLQNVLIDGYDGAPGYGQGEDETCLDIEMAISMATNLAAVVVFEAPNRMSYWNDVLNTMASSNQIKQFSSSWGYSGSPSATSDQIFQQMAAQGQSFFQASGDGDAWTNPIWEPAESSYLTTVGGTTLLMSAGGTNYSSEHVWNWGNCGSPWYANGNGYWGSGGGSSSNYTIPYWQTNMDMTANLGSTNWRNIPDVAMTADNIYVTYGSGSNDVLGGTSCAAPLWAGYTALMNEQAMGMGQPAAGFLNPAIYALGASTNYGTCFRDVTVGDNTWPGSTNEYFAVPGFDLCTGWGTPAGTNLINVLAGAADSLVIEPQETAVAYGAAGGPFSGSSQVFSLNNGCNNALNWSLVNTSSWLTVSQGVGSLVANGSASVVVTLNPIANTLAPGTYSATVFFTNQTTQVGQPRMFTLQVGQSLVRDGGFESGTFSYWTLAGNTIMMTTNGPFIYNAVENPAAGFNVAHSGVYGAFLGDSPPATLSQTLPTCAGQSYLLSFWLNNPQAGADQFFEANWITNGAATNSVCILSNPPAFGWTNLNFVVTAMSTNSVVQFAVANPPNYFGLDDVSVTPIPPATIVAVSESPGGFQMTWNTLANVNYVMQCCSDLSQSNWVNLSDPITAASSTLTGVDTNDLSAISERFYRVIISP